MPKYIVFEVGDTDLERIEARNVMTAAKQFHNDRDNATGEDDHTYAVALVSEVTLIEAAPMAAHSFSVVE